MQVHQETETAIVLMKMALALLDKADEAVIALHLQNAIDVAQRTPVPTSEAEVGAMLGSPEARALLERLVAGPNTSVC